MLDGDNNNSNKKKPVRDKAEYLLDSRSHTPKYSCGKES